MKTTLVSAAAVAVMAATVSAETTGCAAQSILDACLATTESYLTLCGSQDFSCLCDKYTTIMTCFNNCPNDDRQYTFDSQRQLYCANASAFSSKTTTAKSATQTSSTSAQGTDDAKPTDDAATSSGGSRTTTGSSPQATGDVPDAAAVGQRSGSLLAAFAGVAVAALL